MLWSGIYTNLDWYMCLSFVCVHISVLFSCKCASTTSAHLDIFTFQGVMGHICWTQWLNGRFMWLLLLSAAAVSTAGKGLGEGLRLALTKQGKQVGSTSSNREGFFFFSWQIGLCHRWWIKPQFDKRELYIKKAHKETNTFFLKCG